MQLWRLFLFFLCILLLVSCGAKTDAQQQAEGPDYQQTKEMVLDVMHTSEGKKVIQEIIKEPEFKQHLVLQQSDVEKSIQKSLQEEQSKKEWEKLFKNPQVATNLMKATETQQKELLKTLLKDPEYQKALMDLFKDPEFSKHLLQLMKSQEYRKETMKIMEEMLKTPSFHEKVMKLIKEGAQQKEGMKQQEENDDSEGGQQQGQQGT